ncbi:MAG: hypothetical protein Q9182_001140 [Xanthomendoza sp. 2 TL-2023]
MACDILGGNASSLVATTKSTGTSIVVRSSLGPVRGTHSDPAGAGFTYVSSSLKFCSRFLYQFTASVSRQQRRRIVHALTGPMNAIPRILICVEVQHPLTDQFCVTEASILKLTTCKLKLVAKVRDFATFDNFFQRCETFGGSSIWCANGEDMSDQLGIPQSNPVHDGTTPRPISMP